MLFVGLDNLYTGTTGKQFKYHKIIGRVYLIGGALGSLAAIIITISPTQAGRPVGEILTEQLKTQLPPDLMKSAEDILKELSSGKAVETVPPALNVIFRRSVQPYMISWLRYDPAKEIAKLNVPVMITQGTTDIQATAQDVKSLAAAKPSATVLMIDGMNHVLKAVTSDKEKQLASYSDSSLPVMPKLIDEISRFVNYAKK